MELDVFVPSQQLAFEYQGAQHFQEVRGKAVPCWH
jgi:hypothetical protein